jgi:hypothetical protein
MSETSYTVRSAHQADAFALQRLAQLDSAEVPAAPLLIGELDGRLVAALSLSDGTVIADPFVPTVELVALLRLRSRQSAGRPHRLRLRLTPIRALAR